MRGISPSTPMRTPIHVYPENDVKEHEISRSCWCQPSDSSDDPDPRVRGFVIVHNRVMDQVN